MFALHRVAPRILLTLTTATLAVACDDSTATERAAELDGELGPDGGPHGKGRHGKSGHGKHGPGAMFGTGMLDKVCDQVACSDDQRTELQSLLEGLEGTEAERAQHEAKAQAHHEALAAAFEADPFDADAVAAIAAQRDAAHAAKAPQIAKALVEGHAVFTAQQRQDLVTMVEAFGPMMMGRRGPGHGGKHHAGGRGQGKGDGTPGSVDWATKKAEHAAARLCEKVECTGDQESRIAAAVADVHASDDGPSDAQKTAMQEAVVAALQAGALDEAKAAALVGQLATLRDAHRPRGEALLDELHGILSAAQRAQVAAMIREHGPRALMGGRGGRGGRHGGRGRAG